jgi:sec-independent protein translocase protein TatA
MFANMFDSPWKIAILAVVILVLFGSRKLPDAARSLGKSMRILKTEISTLHDDEEPKDTATATPAAATPAVAQQPAAITHEQQVDQLQRQLDELRKQSSSADARQTHQPS